MILIKIHKSYRYVVAICDSELLGKKFEQGRFQLDIKESFFKGKKTSKEKTIQTMKKMSIEDSTFNIIGEKSITCALEAGIISKEGIKTIQDIPFALVLI
ncbi:MAG: DUF424 domain-containing protein [archaeon]